MIDRLAFDPHRFAFLSADGQVIQNFAISWLGRCLNGGEITRPALTAQADAINSCEPGARAMFDLERDGRAIRRLLGYVTNARVHRGLSVRADLRFADEAFDNIVGLQRSPVDFVLSDVRDDPGAFCATWTDSEGRLCAGHFLPIRVLEIVFAYS